MDHEVESVLGGDDIEDPMELISECRFGLGNRAIKVKVYRRLVTRSGGEFEAYPSHTLLTPTQCDAYPKFGYGDSEASALRNVVHGLTNTYQQAVTAGHDPDDFSLQPNDMY